MQRTRLIKKPNLILCSDMHLREDTPTCFTGDWHQEQWKAVDRIRHLQQEYKCPVVHAGDLFDHWKPSPGLISQALWFLPECFYTIYGQHDLPQHSWELRNKSGLHTLEVAGKIYVLPGCHYGEKPEQLLEKYLSTQSIINFEHDRSILVWHHMTYLTSPFPGASEGMAEGILRKYPMFDLIVTGDNHQAFTIEYQGRRLVNPGNMTRQDAKQIDFEPRVWLWYADTNDVEPVYLPYQDGVISSEHLISQEQKNERVNAFITSLDGNWEISTSFDENLKEFMNINQVRSSVKEIVYKSFE